MFNLIDSGLIKLVKRGKTWVVLVLFIILIGVTAIGFYSNNKVNENGTSTQTQF